MRIAVNGTQLFFDVDGPQLVDDGPTMRERPTVLLLHGGPGFDHSNFKPAYQRLTALAQVVYLDHRGNGRSDRGVPASWRLDVWADDVKAFCDALEIERPIVLGWSFGGFVAQAYASRYPDHPAKLILQSTAARFDVDRVVAGFQAVGGETAAAAARAFWSDPTDDSMAGYLQHCLPCYSPEPLDAAAMTRCLLNMELLKGFEGEMEMDQRVALKSVACPTLVLAGDLDPITPVGAADEIVEALDPSLVTYQRFERSGHFIQDTEPDRFFDVLTRFIGAAG